MCSDEYLLFFSTGWWYFSHSLSLVYYSISSFIIVLSANNFLSFMDKKKLWYSDVDFLVMMMMWREKSQKQIFDTLCCCLRCHVNFSYFFLTLFLGKEIVLLCKYNTRVLTMIFSYEFFAHPSHKHFFR